VERRIRAHLTLGLALFCFSVGTFAKESGLSKEEQIELISSLQSYQALQSEASQKGMAKHPLQSDEPVGLPCPEIPLSDDNHCLEKKYISNGNYIVRINFARLDKFAEQPRAPLIKGVRPLKRDTTDRDAYLSQVSDEVFREYIGQDYNRFNEIELMMITRRSLVIELQVKEALELEEVLKSPYINYVKHIGNPQVRLEEVTN